jgi:EAL domain-containing protein (putative c-di-GMP-specific phosphodiesterase class I)
MIQERITGKQMLIGKYTFLVVEDHAFQRRAMVRMLADCGAHNIHEAADGHAALRILDETGVAVDIIISDLDMPGMDGMEFLRHLGESGTGISIILASSLDANLLSSIATMSEAYGISLLGAVEKPLSRAKLESLIMQHRPPTERGARRKAAGQSITMGEMLAGLEGNEFEPHFQPKVALASGRIVGAEALARWASPRLGMVMPSAFIKSLEDNGLIDELTWIMVRKAAASCSRWRSAGLDATVSVNLSLKSLVEMNVAERITEIVGKQNLEPRHMVLELTESAVPSDVGKVLEDLARLRMKGFGLSIDDYGTGYSSMQQLTRIAFTELKVDQSFVMNAAKPGAARVMLESSLDMAKKLHITSVAEGVESKSDFDLLCQLDCDMAQGYFIARPMAYAAFLNWSRSWQMPAMAS